jgi:hypothetical protein
MRCGNTLAVYFNNLLVAKDEDYNNQFVPKYYDTNALKIGNENQYFGPLNLGEIRLYDYALDSSLPDVLTGPEVLPSGTLTE